MLHAKKKIRNLNGRLLAEFKDLLLDGLVCYNVLEQVLLPWDNSSFTRKSTEMT